MKTKQKMSDEKKAILIYSGELALFSLIFLTLGILRIVGVIAYSETRRLVFNFITLAGAVWAVADFIWALKSPKRRAKISMVDKVIALPLVAFMVTYDLISLIAKPANTNFYQYCVGAAIIYGACMMMFEAIYHYFKPIQGLIDSVLEEAKEKEELEAQNGASKETTDKKAD